MNAAIDTRRKTRSRLAVNIRCGLESLDDVVEYRVVKSWTTTRHDAPVHRWRGDKDVLKHPWERLALDWVWQFSATYLPVRTLCTECEDENDRGYSR